VGGQKTLALAPKNEYPKKKIGTFKFNGGGTISPKENRVWLWGQGKDEPSRSGGLKPGSAGKKTAAVRAHPRKAEKKKATISTLERVQGLVPGGEAKVANLGSAGGREGRNAPCGGQKTDPGAGKRGVEKTRGKTKKKTTPCTQRG